MKMKTLSGLVLATGMLAGLMASTTLAEPVKATPGQAVNAVLLPNSSASCPSTRPTAAPRKPPRSWAPPAPCSSSARRRKTPPPARSRC